MTRIPQRAKDQESNTINVRRLVQGVKHPVCPRAPVFLSEIRANNGRYFAAVTPSSPSYAGKGNLRGPLFCTKVISPAPHSTPYFFFTHFHNKSSRLIIPTRVNRSEGEPRIKCVCVCVRAFFVSAPGKWHWKLLQAPAIQDSTQN